MSHPAIENKRNESKSYSLDLEALNFCRSIVRSCADDVIHQSQRFSRLLPALAHATAKANRGNSSARRLDSFLKSNPLVKVIDTVRYGTTNGIQLQTHSQGHWLPAACGHYAIHNAICILGALLAPSDPQCQEWLRMFRSPASFWLSIHEQMQCLRDRAKYLARQKKSYWSEEEINSSEIHREYMKYLLEAYPPCRALGSHMSFSSIPSISLREMRSGVLTASDVHRIQSIFDSFVDAPSIAHAFVLGAGDHWICVVANKHEKDLELILLESYNGPILSKSREELVRMADEEVDSHIPRYKHQLAKHDVFGKLSEPERDRILREGSPYPHKFHSLDERKDSLLKSWIDMQHSFSVLRQCLTGETRLASLYIDVLVDCLRDTFKPTSYEGFTLEKIPINERHLPMIPIATWLKHDGAFCHPSFVTNVVCQHISDLGPECMTKQAGAALQDWVNQVHAHIRAAGFNTSARNGRSSSRGSASALFDARLQQPPRLLSWLLLTLSEALELCQECPNM